MGAVARPAHSFTDSAHSPPQRRSRLPIVLELTCVFVAYVAAGRIGLAVPFTSGNISPLFPPAGVALAAMLIFGYRVWPAVALGAFIVNFFTPIPHLAAVAIAVGNTVGPLCGTWLLRRRRFQPSLDHLQDVLGISIGGALCGTAVSASVGAGTLFVFAVKAWSGVGSAWLMWWVGDALGVLIITPLVLTLIGMMPIRRDRRPGEFVCLLLGATASALMIFDPRLGLLRADAFAFVVFPFVLWGAIRFEAAGAAVASFVISAIAVWGTAHGFGPFIKGNALQNATLLQSFLAVTAVSGLVLAAVITEREKLIRQQSTHAAVAQSERNYRGIVETAYEGIWKLDSNFVTSFVNQRMAELLGYTVEEMRGRSILSFLFESDIAQKRADLQRRQDGVSEQIETRYRKKNGDPLWARATTSPIIGYDGAFEGALAMVTDITEQRAAGLEAHHSRQLISLLSQAVEQTADAVVITDHNGIIEYVNRAFEGTTGYSREYALGKNPKILKSDFHDEAFYARLWNQILDGEPFRGTIVNRKNGGELYWTEQTITPIKDSTGAITHFVSVHTDITELRKQQEQELQLGLGREVQQRFYAGTALCVGPFEIASAAHPAAETGGDYLDLFFMADGRICVGIGDASGHGLGSAIVMALTRAYVRAFAHREADLAKILRNVNQMLIADRLEHNRFVTLLLVCLDPANSTLSYASAGHLAGYLMNASGEVEHMLESSGPPLGLFGDPQFVTSEFRLRAPQTLVLVTDGATESSPAEDLEFGTERVLNYVRAHVNDPAHEIAEGIYRAARAFAEKSPQEDDITAVIVKVR